MHFMLLSLAYKAISADECQCANNGPITLSWASELFFCSSYAQNTYLLPAAPSMYLYTPKYPDSCSPVVCLWSIYGLSSSSVLHVQVLNAGAKVVLFFLSELSFSWSVCPQQHWFAILRRIEHNYKPTRV